MAMGTELIFDERKQIEQMLKLGCKTGSIAVALGRSHSCIKQEIRRGYGKESYNAERCQKLADIKKSRGNEKKRKNLSQYQIDGIKEGIEKGLSMCEMNKRFKIGYWKLRNYLVENNIDYQRKNYAGFDERISTLEMQMEIVIEKLKEKK